MHCAHTKNKSKFNPDAFDETRKQHTLKEEEGKNSLDIWEIVAANRYIFLPMIIFGGKKLWSWILYGKSGLVVAQQNSYCTRRSERVCIFMQSLFEQRVADVSLDSNPPTKNYTQTYTKLKYEFRHVPQQKHLALMTNHTRANYSHSFKQMTCVICAFLRAFRCVWICLICGFAFVKLMIKWGDNQLWIMNKWFMNVKINRNV